MYHAREQFNHVAYEENSGNPPECCPNWYNTIKSLGTLDGCEVVTITNDGIRPYNEPCESYLDTLRRGVPENYSDMTDVEINQYLMSCIR